MKLPTRRSLVLSIFLLGSILTLHAAAPDITLPTWHTGPRGDLAFITSGFMATTAYRKPDSVDTDFAPDGAYGPLNRAWDAWVDSIAPKLNLAAHWMIDPRNETPGRAKDAPYTHRFYLDADAVGETGVLTHDDALVKRSRAYLRDGIAHQQPDGADPEKGGTDTSYHVVGLLFAMNYYTLVAYDDMRAQLAPTITHGLDWLAARIRPDGTVDQTGNTRTGFGQERGPQGNLKTMSYGSAYRAFFYWAMITHNAADAHLASQLYAGQQVENAQRKAAH